MARAKKERAKYVAVIESLDQEGRGVARRDGKVVFIEGALPGERCVVAVAQPCQHIQLRSGGEAGHGRRAVAQHLIDEGGGTGLPVADGDGAAQVEAGELQIYELTGGRDGVRIAGET